jgi:hypothetical protein
VHMGQWSPAMCIAKERSQWHHSAPANSLRAHHGDHPLRVCGGGGQCAQQAGEPKEVVAVQVGHEDGLNAG